MVQISRQYHKSGHSVSGLFLCTFPFALIFIILDSEVLMYYQDGMRVPDDVTLMWTDDKCVVWILNTKELRLTTFP